jgi:tetratricopeptide (TPR) repeat protein
VRNPDRRPPLPARLSVAERGFYAQLRRVADSAGLSCRGLELATVSARSEAGPACFYSKSQWARWLNGGSPPPRRAVTKLASFLSGEGIDASLLTELWDRAFAEASPALTPAGPMVPRQLPSPVGHFVGREAELAALTALADEVETSTGPVVRVIEGTAGVGKTTLAIQAAHALSDRFPDGQLYVNLHGFDPAGGPMPTVEALSGFLVALSAGPASQPLGVQELAALYRTVLAGKRVLVLIDNARDASQVCQLLPGGPGSLVLVTSRSQTLCALSTVGARPLRVQPFSAAEARELLAWRLGSDRVSREPGAADELGELCARLPLALSVAAAHAEMRPGFSLTAVAGEFRSRGLDLLETGEPQTTARHVFGWSYQYLSEEAARVFRLLGVVPGPDVPVHAAASLTATPSAKVYVALDELARAHLAEEHLPGRFRFHDLLRTYAAELAAADEVADERHEAARRMLDHYLHSAMSASTQFRPGRFVPEPRAPLPGVAPASLCSREAALAWFEAEIRVLLALIGYADANGLDEYAWQIPLATAPYLLRSGRHRDWVAAQRTAVGAASRLGDPVAQAHSHYFLAYALSTMGDNAAAEEHLAQSLELFRGLGDGGHEAMALNGRAIMLSEQGRTADALEVALDGLRIVAESGYWGIQARLESTVGRLLASLGEHERALEHCERGLALEREAGNHCGVGDVFCVIGQAYEQHGDLDQARRYFEQAIDVYRKFGAAFDEADTLTKLGDALAASGSGADDGPRAAWLSALLIFDGLSSQIAQAQAEQVKRKLGWSTEPAPR